MLSDPLEDEDRFRILIGEAIKGGEVERYETFMKGYVKGKEARQKAARAEGEEAEAYAKELGIHDKLFPKDKKSKKGSGEDALMALILKGQQEKRGFLEALEAKYAAPSKSRKGRKRTTDDTEHDLEDEMPSEEAFQAAAAKLKAGKEKAESQRKTKKSRR